MPKLSRIFIGFGVGLLAGLIVGFIVPLVFAAVMGAITQDSSYGGAGFFVILTVPGGAIVGTLLGLFWAQKGWNRK